MQNDVIKVIERGLHFECIYLLNGILSLFWCILAYFKANIHTNDKKKKRKLRLYVLSQVYDSQVQEFNWRIINKLNMQVCGSVSTSSNTHLDPVTFFMLWETTPNKSVWVSCPNDSHWFTNLFGFFIFIARNWVIHSQNGYHCLWL